MSGISLTSSMRSNLLSLQGTSKLMDLTQQRLSTGKKVNSAIDNPSNFYTAQSLNNRAKDLDALLDSMGQAVSTIKAASEAMESVLAFLEQASSIANQALSETTAVQKQADVKLVDNSAELLATGDYIEVNSSTTLDELTDLLAVDDAKIVLTEDVDLGEQALAITGKNVTINGAGHKITVSYINIHEVGAEITNVEIDATNAGYGERIYAGESVNINNVKMYVSGVDATGIRLDNEGNKIENVFIDMQGRYAQGIYAEYTSELKNITVNLSSDAYCGIRGAGGIIDIDGLYVSGGKVGVHNRGYATFTGPLADKFDENGEISVEEVNSTFASLSDDSFEKQYNTVMEQYDALIGDASYKGVNLLKNEKLSVSFNEDGSSKLDIQGKDMGSVNLGMTEAVWRNHSDVNNSVEELSKAISAVRTFISELGNNYAIVQSRENFTENLINILTEGADKLTLADMNEESANMLSLQTRQQLAVNALSLASQASQSVLKLF